MSQSSKMASNVWSLIKFYVTVHSLAPLGRGDLNTKIFLCVIFVSFVPLWLIFLMWYRVFGSNDSPIQPAALLAYVGVPGHFRGDDEGWFRVDLVLDPDCTLALDRYLVTEEGIRAELNNWAAWLEINAPEPAPLMQQMISTRQVFVWKQAGDERFNLALCHYLAQETVGLYQIDGQGFFAADGTLLVRDDS